MNKKVHTISLVNASFMQRLRFFFGLPIKPPKLSHMDCQAYGMALHDIVNRYCVHYLYGKAGYEKPEPNSNLAKHLILAISIVGIFHYSEPEIFGQNDLLPNSHEGGSDFKSHLRTLLAIDIPELNIRKERFAKSLDRADGLDLITSIMRSVFDQDIAESNLEQLPKPTEIGDADSGLKMIDATIFYSAAKKIGRWAVDGFAIAVGNDGVFWESESLKWTHWKDFSPTGLVFTKIVETEKLKKILLRDTPLAQWSAWQSFDSHAPAWENPYGRGHGFCLGQHRIAVKAG